MQLSSAVSVCYSLVRVYKNITSDARKNVILMVRDTCSARISIAGIVYENCSYMNNTLGKIVKSFRFGILSRDYGNSDTLVTRCDPTVTKPGNIINFDALV